MIYEEYRWNWTEPDGSISKYFDFYFDLLGSNLGRDTEYHDCSFVLFFLFHPDES
jgi:hypothetical protein